ncbi:response regulator [Phyllobacterium phragmitis]|uniref:Response regulator n=1 Tax=Phyllobacterium phragmitis TaxID=2670329 RepID=A0A2S9IT79_9HYPH|nr:response regulator [Phyllobacterium phragmitis]PRD43744.1 response regulator [Phyllobacterium phragmitis]
MTDQSSPTTPHLTVLVVEDEPLVRISATDFLMRAGFKVYEAANADEAVEILSSRADVHAVFTDVHMPGSLNGVELAKMIHKNWPGIAVVVTSGLHRETANDLPESAAFITKPYLPETIITLIHQGVTPQIVIPKAADGLE